MIKDSVVDANEQLLSTGVLGLVSLKYNPLPKAPTIPLIETTQF